MTTTPANNQYLPEETIRHINMLASMTGARNAYFKALRDAGWSLRVIAEAADMSRERVRQIITEQPAVGVFVGSVPVPLEKPVKVLRVRVQPHPDVLARMLELQPVAEMVRSNGTFGRAAGEEYSQLMSDTLDMGVTAYRLAQLLGITPPAIRFRLIRYGFRTAKTGVTGDVYRPIKAANRYTENVPNEATPDQPVS